jgi:hypothetical protein
MAGAVRTLSEAECELVGGHTSEGSELALGFAVNAVVSTDAMLRKVRTNSVAACWSVTPEVLRLYVSFTFFSIHYAWQSAAYGGSTVYHV